MFDFIGLADQAKALKEETEKQINEIRAQLDRIENQNQWIINRLSNFTEDTKNA